MMAVDNFTVDFSAIGQLPEIARKARIEGARQRELEALGGGSTPIDVSRALFKAGDIEGGLSLAKLGDAQAMREWQMKTDARDYEFRKQEAERAQRNADRTSDLHERQFTSTVEGGKVPPGWRSTGVGGLEPIPRGPADPAYIQTATEARQKPREFTVTDITKLSEEGGKFANVSGFANTFEPRFSGYVNQTLGNAAMTVGRNMPSLASKDTVDAARWWQGYDRFKNVARNELFGAALTKTEEAAFERADINPSMHPDTIKANLTLQQQIVTNALKRKANAMISSGYDPKAIAGAYGLKLEDLGISVEQQRGRRSSPSTPAPAPAPAPAPIDRKPSPEAIQSLKANPRLAEQFDEYYGVGAAARALGVIR